MALLRVEARLGAFVAVSDCFKVIIKKINLEISALASVGSQSFLL